MKQGKSNELEHLLEQAWLLIQHNPMYGARFYEAMQWLSEYESLPYHAPNSVLLNLLRRAEPIISSAALLDPEYGWEAGEEWKQQINHIA